MSISQLRSRNTILCSTSVLCIAGGFHVAEDPNHGSFCFASMPQKMNREISRCWKVDSFSFDWPSFPHSSSHRHPLKIPVVLVCHHVSTSSPPETAGWQARASGAKAGRVGGMRPYSGRVGLQPSAILHQLSSSYKYCHLHWQDGGVGCCSSDSKLLLSFWWTIRSSSVSTLHNWTHQMHFRVPSSHAPRSNDDTWQLAPHLPTQRLFYHTTGDQDGELGELGD